SLLFHEFDDERFPHAAGKRAIRHGYRRGGISVATADVVADGGGVAEELNFLRLRRVQLRCCAISANAQRQTVIAVHIYKEPRHLLTFNTRADGRQGFENGFLNFTIRRGRGRGRLRRRIPLRIVLTGSSNFCERGRLFSLIEQGCSAAAHVEVCSVALDYREQASRILSSIRA